MHRIRPFYPITFSAFLPFSEKLTKVRYGLSGLTVRVQCLECLMDLQLEHWYLVCNLLPLSNTFLH